MTPVILASLSLASAATIEVEELGGPGQTVFTDADDSYKTSVLNMRVDGQLISIAPYIAFETGHQGADLMNFVVYEETMPNQWDLIWSSAPTVIGTTFDFQDSGLIDLPLLANTRYAVGSYFPAGNYIYQWEAAGPPADFGWGFFDGSIWSASDSTPFLPGTISQTPDTHGYYVQITVEVPEDEDLDGFEVGEDCDDTDPTRYPGAPEQCDGVDDDCNGTVDDNVVYFDWFADIDGDTYGDPADVVAVCDGSEPSGYVDNELDCDDTAADVNPEGIELCDGRDGDCNGTVDDNPFTFTMYPDTDADSFGDGANPNEICDGIVPVDHVTNDQDCNDADPTSYPGADEICDGGDNDCDGEIDENQVFTTFYTDADGDGFGDALFPIESCGGAPFGGTSDRTDCDDTDADRFPGNEEFCDGKDNDCDLLSGGEGDFDGDGWLDCEDCRSNDATTFPGATEICDGIDHDCDGVIPDRLDCDPAPGEVVAVAKGCAGCTSIGAPVAGWILFPLLCVLLRRRRG